MEPGAVKQREATPKQDVSAAQLREAERGLRLMLARKFSARWIAENAGDLLGQANAEYMQWLKHNPPAHNPVGWLLTCAYRRALNLLAAQTRRPRATPLEEVFHLADDSTPTPEQEALDHDRQRRLRQALGFLPDKERALLALVYFEGLSIREAGRKVGWQKSAADRHHDAALRRMRALVGERGLLSPASLGLAAWVAMRTEGDRSWPRPLDSALGAAREGATIGAEALAIAAHRAGELWRRLAPFSEPGNPLATSGAGRAAGYCGAAVGAVVCGLAATGVIAPQPSLSDAHRSPPPRQRQAASRQAATPAPPSSESPAASAPEGGSHEGGSHEGAPIAGSGTKERQASQPRPAPRASGRQVSEEFGIESGSGAATAPESGAEEPSSSTASPSPSPAPSSPRSATTNEFGL